MSDTSAQRSFFVALLLFVTFAFLWLIRGFVQPIFWAVALGIIVYPLHSWAVPKLRGREGLAAGASVLFILIAVILPLIGLGVAVTTEAAGLYQRLTEGNVGLQGLFQAAQDNMPQVLNFIERFGLDPERLQSQISTAAVTVSRFVASRMVAFGQDTVRIMVFFFLTLYLLFFFLRDGTRLLERLVRALPLGDRRERLLLRRFADVSRATIKGTLVVGAVQGLIGGLAFGVLGIGAPVLWGVVMALLSIIPAVGTALVWLPAAIMLIVNERIIAGVALILVGVLVIGLVDNLLRPVLVGRDTRMPDYLVLLATLGGLAGFGFAGIVIGPIIAAFFLSVWGMAEDEFRDENGDPSPGSAAHVGDDTASGNRADVS